MTAAIGIGTRVYSAIHGWGWIAERIHYPGADQVRIRLESRIPDIWILVSSIDCAGNPEGAPFTLTPA